MTTQKNDAGPVNSSTGPQYLILGQILRPHGIQGELRMLMLTDYPERITELEQVYLGDSPDSPKIQPYKVEHMRLHQGYGLLKLQGINDRTYAENFRQLQVMVAIEDAVPLEEGEFYLYQLIGVQVETEEGQVLGVITDILETGANDVYIIDSPDYGELLIPATDETILSTDIAKNQMIVRLPEGLLPA